MFCFCIAKQKATELETDLQPYETQYQILSPEFYKKFMAGELAGDTDFVEWSFFYQMPSSVRERWQTLVIKDQVSRPKSKNDI